MSGHPSFSVIVPVYGVEKYMERFADSLLGQTYGNIQFVFVNDGTKDSSIAILEDLIDRKYSHLKDRIVIVHKENAGLPAARMTGMDHATGDYILHVDSDDWLQTDALEKIAAVAADTGSEIIYFDFYKEYFWRSKLDREREYDAGSRMKYICRMFNYRAYGYVWNKCVRKSLYERCRPRFPSHGMHEDIFLMSQLLYHARSIVHLPEALYHYRRDNPGSISSAKRMHRRHDSALNMMELYEYYKDDLMNSPIRDAYGEILFRTGWLSIRYGFGFFDRFPYLAERILAQPLSFRHKTFILRQIVTKVYAFFREFSVN